MTAHSEFRKGQSILILFKDGSKLVTKYVDKNSRYINTRSGSFPNKNLRQVVIYKGVSHD